MDNGVHKENEATRVSGYTVNSTQLVQEDEIDLVDLWITMWSYRKLFLSSAILVAIVGILFFELLYNEKPTVTATVRSIIEIGSKTVSGTQFLVESPDVLAHRIEISKLREFSSMSSFSKISSFIMSTSIIPYHKTHMLEFRNVVPVSAVTEVSEFHGQLVEAILLDIKEASNSLMAGTRDTLFTVKSRMIELRGLQISLDQDLKASDHSGAGLSQSSLYEMELRKENIQAEIDILQERAGNLEQMLSDTGSVILLKADVSEKSTSGMNKPQAYSLIIVTSLVLAVFVTMAAIFIKNVKQRMAGEG